MAIVFKTEQELQDNRKWLLVDAKGKTVGRLASQIAALLRGKHQVTFATYADAGDFVIVINAGEVKFTGKKLEQKEYHRHTGYIGGVKTINAEKLLREKPEKVLYYAVQGMLPKGPLGRKQLTKLKIYAGVDHPHSAQCPVKVDLLPEVQTSATV